MVAGEGRRVLQCPLQLLYPLEICAPPCESEASEPELKDFEVCKCRCLTIRT